MDESSGSPETSADSKPAARRRPRGLKCVLVEDQAMFLELLRGMLAIQVGLRIVGQAKTVAEGIAACDTHVPDVLLLDLSLPDGDGVEVARHFLQRNPAGRVVISTGQKTSFVCPSWLDGNLQALISKNDTFQALRAELEELVWNVRPEVKARAGSRPGTPLSEREAEVFALIGEGLSSREIADHLQIALHTVLTHRKRIAKKLGTSGNGLVTRAVARRATFLGPNGEPQ